MVPTGSLTLRALVFLDLGNDALLVTREALYIQIFLTHGVSTQSWHSS
jgi:hypothetical protein